MKIKGINFSEDTYTMVVGGDLDLGDELNNKFDNTLVKFRDGIAMSDNGRIVLHYSTLTEVRRKISHNRLSVDDFDIYHDFQTTPVVNFWMVYYVTCKETYIDGVIYKK